MKSQTSDQMMKKTLNGSPFTRRLTVPLACAAFGFGLTAVLALAGGFKSPAAAGADALRSQPPAGVTAAPAAARADAPAERLETELVTITPTGFDPAEITRPQGRFILEVDNRGGFEEVALHLDALRGAREREARVPRTTLDWRDEFDLRPGTYVLREAGHPEWECRITITPR